MNFSNDFLTCTLHLLDQRVIHIQGSFRNASKYDSMTILAPHAIDRMTSYGGSGLPWPCPTFAFEGTKNVVEVKQDGRFEGTLGYPNSYYTDDGLHKVPPSIFAIAKKDGDAVTVRMELPEEETLKLRTLTHRTRHMEGPIFYAEKEALMGVPKNAEAAMLTYKNYKSQYNIA